MRQTQTAQVETTGWITPDGWETDLTVSPRIDPDPDPGTIECQSGHPQTLP